MTHQQEPVAGGQVSPDSAASPVGPPTLPEDLLLLLFQPDSGSIAGETTLFYVLAAAVLADLALEGRVTTTKGALGSTKVEGVAGQAPTDEILRAAWDSVADTARGVQALLAALGPPLREPLLERLIARGDLRRQERRALGVFPIRTLRDGPSGRRATLLEDVRRVLVDGAEPTPRVAALAALLYGSGTLPQFDRDIPWSAPVINRAQALQQGNWGAGAAAEAVTRTMTAIIASSVIIANSGPTRNR